MFETVNSQDMLSPADAINQKINAVQLELQSKKIITPPQWEILQQYPAYIKIAAQILDIDKIYMNNAMRYAAQMKDSVANACELTNFYIFIYHEITHILDFIQQHDISKSDQAIIKQCQQFHAALIEIDNDRMYHLCDKMISSLHYLLRSHTDDEQHHCHIMIAEVMILKANLKLMVFDDKTALSHMLDAIKHIQAKITHHDYVTIYYFMTAQKQAINLLNQMLRGNEALILCESMVKVIQKFYDKYQEGNEILIEALTIRQNCHVSHADYDSALQDIKTIIKYLEDQEDLLLIYRWRIKEAGMLYLLQRDKTAKAVLHTLSKQVLSMIDSNKAFCEIIQLIAETYDKQNDYAAAYPLWLKAYDIATIDLGIAHYYTMQVILSLTRCLYAQQRYSEAKYYLYDIVTIIKNNQIHISTLTLELSLLLARTHDALNQNDEALLHYEQAYLIMRILYGGADERVVKHVLMLCQRFLKHHDAHKAYKYLLSQGQYVITYDANHDLRKRYLKLYNVFTIDYPELIEDLAQITPR